MLIIKDIEKRQELAEMVYAKYSTNKGEISKEEKDELINEVGAAFGGYGMALEDIIRIIVDGREDSETLKNMTDYITRQLNGKSTKNLFRLSEYPTSQMQNYINSTVKNELMRKGHPEDEATLICRSFIEYPSLREGIIERNDLESIRICEHCGKPMYEGYLINDFNTYCSEECARAATTEMGWPEGKFDYHISNGDEEDDTVYWTQWEG